MFQDETDEGDSNGEEDKIVPLKNAYIQTITLHMVKFSNIHENTGPLSCH